MLIKRRQFLAGLTGSLILGAWLPLNARAEVPMSIRDMGRLRIAVYNDFPPYAEKAQVGIDVDLGRAIAERLGLVAEIIGFNADEDMNDDLRNMVWKGHYLGTRPADLMMHVPVDAALAAANERVYIFGAYHRETLAFARQPERVPPLSGSAAVALEIFTREKIGVETTSLADSFLLSVMQGRLRDNVVHFRTVREAVQALRSGQLSAVLANRAELEAALMTPGKIILEAPRFAELNLQGWPLGMAVKAEQKDSLGVAIQAVLGDLLRDGTVAAIFKRHGIHFYPV